MKDKKIAIVHDYLTQFGGAERTLEAICEAFPDAPVYTSIYSPDETFPSFKKRNIHTSFLQKVYRILHSHRILLPLYPTAFENFNLNNFDVILSSSSSFAKGIKKPPNSLHILYCYNPTRFIWMKDTYIREEGRGLLKGLYLRIFLNYIKNWDLRAINTVDRIIAISNVVRERIKYFYSRESFVIYPPVDCKRFEIGLKDDGYFLVVSRLLAHKRIDIAVRAFTRLGIKLKIVGTGPQYPILKRLAGKNIEFCGAVQDRELTELYSRCVTLVYPQEEDFGIAPLEANASGKPVVAFKKGGVLETMKDGITALFFSEQNPDSLIDAIRKFEHISFNYSNLRQNAMRFDKSVFIEKIKKVVTE